MMSTGLLARSVVFRVLGTAVLAALALCLLFPATFAQEREEQEGGPQARQEWFYHQRAYPLKQTPAGARLRALNQRLAMRQREVSAAQLAGVPINNTSWTLIGPQPTTYPYFFSSTTSGRVTAIAVDTSDATGNTVYIGGAEGGVWKTTNGGTNWTPLTDSQSSLATGSIAVDPNNHLNVYVGLGEENFNLDQYYGGGLLKSTNGGTSWTQIGTAYFGGPESSQEFFGGSYIGAIAIQPGAGASTPVLLAASEISSGSQGANSGIWRSTDGGTTWARVLPTTADENSYGTSVIFVSNTTAYAAIGGIFGDSNSGVYMSTNAGQTWTAANGSSTTVLPTGANVGRITLVAAPSTVTTLYAAIASNVNVSSGLAGMFKSTDGGTTWNPITTPLGTGGGGSTNDFCGSQCWYDMPVAVSPTNASLLYAGGSYNYTAGNGGIYMSTNGGTSWSSVNPGTMSSEGQHPDFHAIAFAAGAGKLYVGNDGGMWSTTQVGATSLAWTNLNATLAITQFYPGLSISDGSANLALDGTQDNGTQLYSGSSWQTVACGDGAWTAIDPTNSNTMWSGCVPQNAYVLKSTNGGSTWNSASTGINTGDPVAFIPPLVMDLKNPSTLYFGTNHVYQTTNGGTAWASISPDLTNGSGDLTAIAVSPVSSTNLFAGTSNNLVWYTINTGGTWTQITSGLPPRYPTMVQGDPQSSTTFYVTFSGFSGFGDSLGHVFKCTTATTSCSDISSNLPNIPANDIVIDPAVANTFYLATDVGVFKTTNGGTSWATFSNGLPNVVVVGMKLHAASRTLRAATHGRSAWDISLSSTQTLQTLTVSLAGTGTGGVSSSPAGIDCLSTCATGFTVGTVVTLTPTPAVGSVFTSWSGSCAGAGACVVTLSGSGTPAVTATFTAATTDTLTVNKTGTGTGTVSSTSPDTQITCGATCSGNYSSGTVVTLSAQAPAGSTFTSWSGCTPTSSTPCTVTVNSNPTTVTATFTASGSAAPVLASLSPSSAIAGGGGFVLTVYGSNFVSGATVGWNSTTITPTFIGSTQLQAAIPLTDIATAGVASVSVTNPAGGGTSNSLTFDVLETFTGSGGFLSMFVNGTDLGNSALFQSGGSIGVGTTSPIRTLDVNGEIQARGGNLFLQRNLVDLAGRRNWAWGTETANVGDMAFFVSTSNSNFPSVNVMTLLSNGNVGIGPIATTPATTLQVGGDIRVGTSGTNGCLQNFAGTALAGTCSSDARLKTNILPFAPILDKLVRLQPVHFDWNAEQYPDYHFGPGRNSGLLAQDVETVFPEMVSADARGFKMVNYSELPYLTLAAIRELKTENDALRSQLAERQRELENLRQQVVAVEARLARLERPPSRTMKKKKAVQTKPAAGARAQQ